MNLNAITLAITRPGGVRSWDPLSLFTAGVNGAWYDPSDLTTLFQNAAGTTPVTAVEQPVGLMLDKSKGLVLGSEAIGDPTFDNPSAWVTGAGWSVSGGKLNASFVAADTFTTTAIGVVTAGKTYQVQLTCESVTAGGFKLLQEGGLSYFGDKTTAGTFKGILTATVTGKVYVWANSTLTATFDNISVRELPGNHAFNPSGNSANFPVLSARYNLLTKTEDFSDAVWNKGGISITANSVVAPDGTLTADTLIATSAAGYIFPPSGIFANAAGATFSYSVYVKANTATTFSLLCTSTVNYTAAFNLSTGVVSGVSANAQASMTAVGDGWYRLNLTLNSVPSQAYTEFQNGRLANGTSAYIWGADLRVSNDTLNQPAYQRVNTATDYDTVGFKPYLKFNGTNQWLQTNIIDFSYGDKVFVCAGVRKLSDAAQAIIAELSASTASNTGSFNLNASAASLALYQAVSKGSSAGIATSPTTYAAPITNVLSGIGDIFGDQAILRVNGTQAAISTSDQGTGNYGNYPLYIGARAGSSLWFNGRLHQLIVAGKQASDSEIGQTEAFVNQKTGAY